MIIGIDGNEANLEKRVGVNQYCYEILWGIYRLQDEWKGKHKIIVFLKEEPLGDMPGAKEFFRYKVIPGSKLWIIKKISPRLVFAKDKPDVFFSPSHYVPLFSPMPRICSIMDLGYLEFSGQFKKYDFWQLKLWSAYSILVSKRVIAISNSTKEDIVRHYPLALGKVHVTHLAYDRKRFNKNISGEDVRRVKNKYSIVDDYILFLSTLKPSKNIEGLLDAFSLVLKEKKVPDTIKLVIAGKKGWLYASIFAKVKHLGLWESVVFTDYLPEEDKPALIAGARVFALPSFWEGFGLDSLNAMACGVPVVVSNKGSLPEVVGNAGILVDPKSAKSIAGGISKVLLADKKEYNSLKERCILQAGKFSWQNTAKETLKIIEGANSNV